MSANISENLNAFLRSNNSSDNLGLVYGEDGQIPGTEYSSDIAQVYSDTCAIRSQQIILRDYGIDISQEALMSISERHGWYTPGEGTSMENVGNLLQLAGVDCHQSYNNTIYDIIKELSQGHRIIVGVDSGELWAEDYYSKLDEKIEDSFGNQTPDHALIVAGVEVNPFKSDDVKIILTDPGTGKLRVEYELREFVDAWKDSNCFMVSTEEPAPYQYDALTGNEVPSGFATSYAHNDFILANDFILSDDDLFVPDNYIAMYSEENTLDLCKVYSLEGALHHNSDFFSNDEPDVDYDFDF